MFKTKHHAQINIQVEWYNRTTIVGLHHLVKQHPNDWDLYMDILTFGNNTKIHKIMNCTLFVQVLSQSPKKSIMELDSVSISGEARGSNLHFWKLRPSHICGQSKRTYAKGAEEISKTVQQEGMP